MDIKNRKGETILTIEADSATGYAFHKQNLEGANFAGMDLTRTGFYKCNLKNANFCGATLHKTDFQVADLSGANLTDANMRWCTLLDTNLAGADLTGADLTWVHFKGAKYSKATKWPKGFDLSKEEVFLIEEQSV